MEKIPEDKLLIVKTEKDAEVFDAVINENREGTESVLNRLHHTIKEFHEARSFLQDKLKTAETDETIRRIGEELKNVIGEIKVCEEQLAAIESLTPKESENLMDGFRN